MNMELAYLLLRLEGPLQSWGDRSKYWRRDSLLFPTKSGVWGLVFCACGWAGSQRERLARCASLPMKVLEIAGRTTQSLLVDMQMVGAHYDPNDPWESLLLPKTSSGKAPQATSGSKITYRTYLQDAAFGVILAVPVEWVDEIERGFSKPKWDLYLGRKNCVPSRPVFQGIYAAPEEAEQALRSALDDEGQQDSPRKIVGTVEETVDEDPDGQLLYDVPIQFGPTKEYGCRYVKSRKEPY